MHRFGLVWRVAELGMKRHRGPEEAHEAFWLALQPGHLGHSLQIHRDAGHVAGFLKHRFAMFWISCLDTPYLVLQNDAPDGEKPVFAAQLQAMLAALGYTSVTAWAERVVAAERLTQEIYSIADALVALHPE